MGKGSRFEGHCSTSGRLLKWKSPKYIGPNRKGTSPPDLGNGGNIFGSGQISFFHSHPEIPYSSTDIGLSNFKWFPEWVKSTHTAQWTRTSLFQYMTNSHTGEFWAEHKYDVPVSESVPEGGTNSVGALLALLDASKGGCGGDSAG